MKRILLQMLIAMLVCTSARAQVNSGSNGSDGTFNPTTNTVINMADHPNGIYQYTSVNIPNGVQVSFIPNAKNTPVIWLVQNNVVINGVVYLGGAMPTGQNYPAYPSFPVGGIGGPGGGAGGNGGSNPTPGQGLGGGGVPAGGGGFGIAGQGIYASGQGGQVYGNASLIPLLGGSGGAGGGPWGAGGGGGGGAIFINASGFVELNGRIDASGTLGFYSGGSSGGGVRLVTPYIFGSGSIWTLWTPNTSVSQDGGGLGRVRIDAFTNSLSGEIRAVYSQGLPPVAPIVVQTNRTPKIAEIGQPTIPNDPNHFKVFTNGAFQSGIALNPNKMTVVLTHGWNGSPSDWAEYTAQIIQQRIGVNAVNIVAWDWHPEASVRLSVATQFTLGEGYKLGTDLGVALGANYSQRIHFIGHSLGTLVNAAAADYLHGHGFSWTNTQMTLCDEAEIAWGTTSQNEALATLFALLDNSSTSQPFWNRPLPRQFNWADNYISACGLLHPEAANAILTWEFPTSFPNFEMLKTEFFIFHDFAHYFYEDTIEPSIFNTGGQTNATYMGFICSFEGGGIASRPATNTYFYQDPNGYELTLVQTNFGFATNFLNQRLWSYIGTIKSSGISWALNTVGNAVVQANGQVQGAIDYTGNLIINLFTGSGSSSPTPNGLVRPMGGPVPNGGSSANNLPAYAWIPLFIPSNTLSMSFDFMLQGDGASDSFQAALNGTNVLSLETMLIQTNVTLNSGMIEVSAYAGKTNEFFVGIVGGTSTNAQLTVQNLVFYGAPAPSLQAQSSGNNPVLTWPISATGFNLQTTTNLADPNSWMTLTNVPAIVNSQNTVTNPSSSNFQFYRLKK